MNITEKQLEEILSSFYKKLGDLTENLKIKKLVYMAWKNIGYGKEYWNGVPVS